MTIKKSGRGASKNTEDRERIWLNVKKVAIEMFLVIKQ